MSELKHERPEYVLSFKKPVNTEIKHIHGKWYLYERSFKYDKEKKKSKKISGKLLGCITPEGFVEKKAKLTVDGGYDVLEFGAAQYFYNHTSTMREMLESYFPAYWKRLYTIALLRTIYNPRMSKIEDSYQDSILSVLSPGLALSSPSISDLMKEIGRRKSSIEGFMKSMADAAQPVTYIVDGHRIISASNNMSDAEIGYDSKMRFKPQLNLLYIFSLTGDNVHPFYYRKYSGDVVDSWSFEDIISSSGISPEDATVIVDKGFMSDDNIKYLKEIGLKYIMPLRRGNHYVKDKVPQSSDGYEESFTFSERSILSSCMYDDGNTRVYLFRDINLLRDEEFDIIRRLEGKNNATEVKRKKEMERRERGKGIFSDEELSKMVAIKSSDELAKYPERGTITIMTDRLELNAIQIYSIYKQRQTIEQGFKTYDDALLGDSSYMHSDASFEAWLFLNHLSMMMVYDAMDEIYKKGLTKTYSFDMFRRLLSKIRALRNDDEWIPCKYTKNTQALLNKLNLDISKVSILDCHPKN